MPRAAQLIQQFIQLANSVCDESPTPAKLNAAVREAATNIHEINHESRTVKANALPEFTQVARFIKQVKAKQAEISPKNFWLFIKNSLYLVVKYVFLNVDRRPATVATYLELALAMAQDILNEGQHHTERDFNTVRKTLYALIGALGGIQTRLSHSHEESRSREATPQFNDYVRITRVLINCLSLQDSEKNKARIADLSHELAANLIDEKSKNHTYAPEARLQLLQDAHSYAKRAIELFPKNPHHGLIYLSATEALATEYRSQGDLDRALSLYETVLADPSSQEPNDHNAKIVSFALTGKARCILPNANEDALLTLDNEQRYRDAHALFRRAWELRESFPASIRHHDDTRHMVISIGLGYGVILEKKYRSHHDEQTFQQFMQLYFDQLAPLAEKHDEPRLCAKVYFRLAHVFFHFSEKANSAKPSSRKRTTSMQRAARYASNAIRLAKGPLLAQNALSEMPTLLQNKLDEAESHYRQQQYERAYQGYKSVYSSLIARPSLGTKQDTRKRLSSQLDAGEEARPDQSAKRQNTGRGSSAAP